MTNNEMYLPRRLNIAESALRHLMAIVIEQSSPNSQALIQRMGFEWDQQLDRIDAERYQLANPIPSNSGELADPQSADQNKMEKNDE